MTQFRDSEVTSWTHRREGRGLCVEVPAAQRHRAERRVRCHGGADASQASQMALSIRGT